MKRRSSKPAFRRLQPGEDWHAGVFFMTYTDRKGNHQTSGVATLLTPDGILATCAHVVMSLGVYPGERLQVYSRVSGATAEAEVLSEGWRGPSPKSLPTGQVWKDIQGFTLEQFQEDVALLRILPETTKFVSLPSKGSQPGDAARALEEACRVLPLAIPNYPPGRTLFSCCLRWAGKRSPDPVELPSVFSRLDPEFRQVQLSTTELMPGDSGAPLWDHSRQAVVAFVRRNIHLVKGVVIATDARAVAQSVMEIATDYRIEWDEPARIFREHFAKHIRDFDQQRNFAITRRLERLPFVQPRLKFLQPSHQRRPASQASESSPAEQVVTRLIRGGVNALILGQPGSGKSTLCYRLAESLLEADEREEPFDLRPIPVVISSETIERLDGDLPERISAAIGEAGWAHTEPDFVREVANFNDGVWIVFLDGLDELDSVKQRQFIRFISTQCTSRNEWLGALFVTSRPIKHLGDHTYLQFAPFELQAFSGDEKSEFIAKWFGDRRDAFIGQLRRHRLYANSGNALLLTMAAVLFDENEALPERPLDLYEDFIELQFGRAETEWATRHEGLREDELPHDRLFYESAREIVTELAYLAFLTGRVIDSDDVVPTLAAEWESREKPAWLVGSGTYLRQFLVDVLAKDSGLFSVTDTGSIEWLHTSIRDVCAAKAVLDRRGESVARELLGRWRDENQHEFLVHLGAMMVARDLETAVMQTVEVAVNRSKLHPRVILFPIRMLAGGVNFKAAAKDKMIRYFARQLLSGQLEMRCQDVFIDANDLLGSWELAKLDVLYGPIIEAIVERIKPLGPRRLRRPCRREIDALERLGATEALQRVATDYSYFGEAASKYALELLKKKHEVSRRSISRRKEVSALRRVRIDLYALGVDRPGTRRKRQQDMSIEELSRKVAEYLTSRSPFEP